MLTGKGAHVGRCAISNFRSTKRVTIKKRKEMKKRDLGEILQPPGDRYSRISMAWKTAVERNLFDVALSNVEAPSFFFHALEREKNIH